MDLVVDANILFSVLIKSGKTEELMFEPELHLFAPQFIFEEFEKYKKELLGKTERSEEGFYVLLNIFKKRIKIIQNEETERYIKEAERICPDPKDVDYFALAIKIRSAIWSNDKDIRSQNKIKIYSTKELIEIFS